MSSVHLYPSDDDDDESKPSKRPKPTPKSVRKKKTKKAAFVYPGPPPPITGFLEPIKTATLQPITAKLLLPNYRPPKPAPVPAGGYLVVDLFCSIGGVSYAAKQLGHTVIMAIDFDPKRLAVHQHNHPDAFHKCLELGPNAEDFVVGKIRELVAPDQWDRLWVHASPPCQAQSMLCSIVPNSDQVAHNKKAKRKADGVDLVKWALHLAVEVLKSPQFSLEEVDDRDGHVRGAITSVMRSNPGAIDFDTFDMSDYGVPQHRHRIIAARPATIHALRNAPSLRRSKVSIRDALGDRIPADAVYYCGPKNAHPIPERAKKCTKTYGKWTDGRVQWFSLDRPAPAVAGELVRWLDAEFVALEENANLSADDIGLLMSFPVGAISWPANVPRTRQIEGYGNAVCPLFAMAMFRAASTEV